MISMFTFPGVGSGTYAANEQQVLYAPSGGPVTKLAGKRVLIAVHGRGGTAAQPCIFTGWMGILRYLTDIGGYYVLSIDCGSQSGGAGTTDANCYKNPWSPDLAMTAITNANTYLLNTLGADGSTKMGALDYSLGAGQAFNWLYRNPGKLSGIISFAPPCDYDYLYTNLLTTNSAGASEMDLSYATTKTTTTGSGTLNQVGSNLTIAAASGLPASGTVILYAIGTNATYVNPVLVTYTGGGGTTTLTGCTIASGSQAWGTGTVMTGICTVGGYNANKATRNPQLIANAQVFDSVPIHCFLGADDGTVGRAASPQTGMVSTWIDTVNADNPGKAQFHSVPGRQRPLLTTVNQNLTITAAGQTLQVASSANFSGGGGSAVIETGAREPLYVTYTGTGAGTLLGVAHLAGMTDTPVSTGMIIYPSAADGHTALLGQDTAGNFLIDPSYILTLVNGLAW